MQYFICHNIISVEKLSLLLNYAFPPKTKRKTFKCAKQFFFMPFMKVFQRERQSLFVKLVKKKSPFFLNI